MTRACKYGVLKQMQRIRGHVFLCEDAAKAREGLPVGNQGRIPLWIVPLLSQQTDRVLLHRCAARFLPMHRSDAPHVLHACVHQLRCL